jgi:hypothetical protein
MKPSKVCRQCKDNKIKRGLMKKQIVVLYIFCILTSFINAQEAIQYTPQNFDKFLGLDLSGDEAKIGSYYATIADNVLVNPDGSIEKRKGCILRKAFSSDSFNTFTYTTEADFALGETKTVDYTTSPGTISLSSTSESWVQGSVTDYDAADSLVNIDSTTYPGMLTISNVDRAADTAGASATCENSYSIKYYPSNAIDRDTGDGSYSPPTGLTYWSQIEGLFDITVPKVGLAGTIEGNPTYAAGKFNDGMFVDAVEGFYIPSAGLYSDTEGCIEFWYKPTHDKNDGARHMIFGSGGSGPNGDLIGIYKESDNTLYFEMQRNGWQDAIIASVDFNWSAGDFVHLAFVWDSAGFSEGGTTYYHGIYINDVFKAGNTNSTFSTDWMKTYLWIGIWEAYATYHADGVIDNLKIWDYAKVDFSDSTTEPALVDTFWASLSTPNTAILTITLDTTTTIGGAGWYNSYATYSPNTFDLQYKDITTGLWDTAVAVINLADTCSWSETFPACIAKEWRLYVYSSDTPVFIQEIYLLPQATYISQWNTDTNIVSGMIKDLTVIDTLNGGYADYYYRTNVITSQDSSWIQIDKNTTLNLTLKSCFQVKTVLTPKFAGLSSICNPIFETFTLNYMYRSSLTGQWVSPKIDRGDKYFLGHFDFTKSDSNTTGTTVVYYQRHGNDDTEVNAATWTYIDTGGIVTTEDRYMQLRADLSTDSVVYTPYVYYLQSVSHDSNVSEAIYGLYDFEKSSGRSYLMTNCESSVYYSEDGNNFTLLGSGFISNYEMCYVTISDTLGNETCVFSNGQDYRRAWDGTTMNTYTGTEQVKPVVMAFMQGYLFGADHSNPNRLYHSLQWQATDLGDTNYIIVPIPAGEWITSLTPMSRLADDITSYLVIQSQTTTWLLKNIASEISSGNLVPVFSELGGRSQYANANIEKNIVFPSNRGIYSFDGENLTDIGSKIQPSYDDMGQVSTGQAYWLTTTQSDWQNNGETKTNIDTTTVEGSIKIKIPSIDVSEFNNVGTAFSYNIYEGFIAESTSRIFKISGNFFFNIAGSITVVCKIYSDNSNTPDALLYSSDIVTVSDPVGPPGTWFDFNFTDTANITNGVRYWIKMEAISGSDLSAKYWSYNNFKVYKNGIYRYGTFNSYSQDFLFKLYTNASSYISPVHNTGIDSPFYGLFESDYITNNQTINFYLRSGTSEANCISSDWNTATIGNYVLGLNNYQYMQYKINLSTSDTTISPIVNSIKINWGTNSAINQASLQGIWWDDYYLLAGAEDGSTYNNVVYAYNIKNQQWVKFVGWYVNRWTRFLDTLRFGDSRNGQIYHAWIGYNDNGEAIVSQYKTKSFNFGAPYTKKELRSIYTTTATGEDTSDLYVYCYVDNQELATVNTIPLYAGEDIIRRINRIEISPEFYYLGIMFYHDDLDIGFKLYDYQFGIKALDLIEGSFIDLR